MPTLLAFFAAAGHSLGLAGQQPGFMLPLALPSCPNSLSPILAFPQCMQQNAMLVLFFKAAARNKRPKIQGTAACLALMR
eukprot:scaffold107693_cov18-Tisochrysis_lutea.AAC.1